MASNFRTGKSDQLSKRNPEFKARSGSQAVLQTAKKKSRVAELCGNRDGKKWKRPPAKPPGEKVDALRDRL